MDDSRSKPAGSSGPGKSSTHHSAPITWLRRVWRDLWVDPQQLRLDTAIADMECRLLTLRGCDRCASGCALQPTTAPDDRSAGFVHDRIHARIDCHFSKAKEAAARGDRYLAYDMLHAIERDLVELMSPDERREEFRARIREGIEKLSGWRREYVRGLQQRYRRTCRRCQCDCRQRDCCRKPTTHDDTNGGASDGVGPQSDPQSDPQSNVDIPVLTLRALLTHIHHHSQNNQHKLELLRRRQVASAVVTIVCVVLALFAISVPRFDLLSGLSVPKDVVALLWPGVLLGLFGGLFSMLTQHGDGAAGRKIPEIRHSLLLAAARPVIGAAISIPIVILFTTGLFGQEAPPVALTLGACFIGGFSERWFIAQVEGFVGGAAGAGNSKGKS